MLFLALAIFGSVFTASFIKWCESRKIDTVGVIASNYLSGSLLGWALVGWNGWPGLSAETVGFGIGGGMLWPSAFLLFRLTCETVPCVSTKTLFRLFLPKLHTQRRSLFLI